MGRDIMYSVIVVCLNAGQRLYETVDSILKQSCPDFEVVVKDGGSSRSEERRVGKECRL